MSAPSIASGEAGSGAAARRLGLTALLGHSETVLEAERENLPLWIPVGLGSGIAAWFALPAPNQWLGFIAATVAFAAAALAIGTDTRTGRAILYFTLATALGTALVWWRAERVAAPVLDRPTVATFDARIEAVQSLPEPDMLRLLVAPSGDPRLPPRVRVAVPKIEGLLPGTVVRLRARLMPPAPMSVPGGYDFSRTAWFKGIGATGKAFDPPIIVSRKPVRGVSARFADWRRRLTEHIRGQIPGAPGAIAASFVTSDQGAIPEADAEAMRRSGLAHLLSVSGLHVAAVVGAAFLLTMKLLALSPTLALRLPLLLIAAALAALTGIAYTLLAGAEVPTIRSCIAALLVLLGLAIGREAITLRLVAVGALVVLLLWPESLAGPSFQLSFAAVTAIVALHEHPRMRAFAGRREEGLPARAARGLATLLLTGLVVEAALIPIALYHFHQAGLFGALANVAAIPLTTFVIMPLEAIALVLDIAGIGAPLWWLAGKAVALLLVLAHLVAAAPGAVARLPSMPAAAFALMIAGGLWLCLWRTRLRRWGLLSLTLGALIAFATPPPDLIVTSDGRHLAIRRPDGTMAILRDRAGDYVRDMFAEVSGYDGELAAIADLPEARCSADLCAFELYRDGRAWRVLATRSAYLVPWREMIDACAAADIAPIFAPSSFTGTAAPGGSSPRARPIWSRGAR